MTLASISSPPDEAEAKLKYDALLDKMEPFMRFPQVEMAIERSRSIATATARLKFLSQRLYPFFDDLSMKAKWEDGEPPVDPQTFLESPRYLNQKGTLYPLVLEEFVELNSGKYIEAVLTGGIGVGKSTIAIFTTAYQLYLISKLKAPQEDLGIAPHDELMFVFQSVSKDLALSVDFQRFTGLIKASPYFQEKFRPNITKDLLVFPKNVRVKALSGATTAALGQNVIGGMLDEVNFMAVTEKSKSSRDGGTFDQAWENYNTIVRRRESRFMKAGKLPGMFCLVSSKNYPGDFTDIKAKEARTQVLEQGSTTIFVYDKRLWDIRPRSDFTGGWFRLFIGDSSRKPRFLADDEYVPRDDQHLVMEVPLEYRKSFESNMLAALRDIAGVATEALHPFILDKDAIKVAFSHRESLLTEEACDFEATKVGIRKKWLVDLHRPRWVHIDLAVTGDSAGVACGYVKEFTQTYRGDHTEVLPYIDLDFTLEVRPPKNGEINFSKIRALLYKLTELGLPIRWVSLDSYQSTDTIQILRQKGYSSELRSVDTSTVPYDVAKQAIIDHRLRGTFHEKAESEFRRLEFDAKKRKIDHPARGSKDCSDAIASVVFGLTMMGETWTGNNVPVSEAPAWLRQLEQETRNKSSSEGRIGA